MYDVGIGRWNGVDPMAKNYDSWSLYNYVLGNPLKFIDPDGRRVGDPPSNDPPRSAEQIEAETAQEFFEWLSSVVPEDWKWTNETENQNELVLAKSSSNPTGEGASAKVSFNHTKKLSRQRLLGD